MTARFVEVDEHRIIAENVAREVAIVRDAMRATLYFDFVADRAVTAQEIGNYLNAFSMRSGVWRCEVARNRQTGRPCGVKYTEMTESEASR